GQQQVRPRLVHILSVQGKDTAPAGGPVFFAGAGVLLVGCNDNGDDCIESSAEQQIARRLRCVIDGERLCQKIVDGSQDASQSGNSIPPHRQPGRCPPDQRQWHQPNPPGGFLLHCLPFRASVGMLGSPRFFPGSSFLPQLRQCPLQGCCGLRGISVQICRQPPAQRLPFSAFGQGAPDISDGTGLPYPLQDFNLQD